MPSGDLNDATIAETPRRRASAPRPPGMPSRYRLADVIGHGGMGCVYRAHDTVLGRDVAIKVIENAPAGTSGDTRPRDRFVREARAAARLAHPNIVAVHDVDPDAGWLVMDLVAGEALRDVAARGPVPPARVRAIAEQVLSALDAAHAAGVIHRDIKPSNIIYDGDKVTLVDFGVARLVDAELTKTGESLGTPAYMAPEQLRGGRVDARTDLYGLAATLYELITGERMIAFETPSADALARMRIACGREHGLRRLVEMCLQAAPERRIASAREALVALSSRPSRVRPVSIACAVAVVVVGALVAWRMVERPTTDSRRAELFALAQRGEHQKAGTLLEHYVAAHPNDNEARAMLLVNIWWETGRLATPFSEESRLSPAHRDMLRGLAFVASRDEDKAVAFLQDAQRRHPTSVEIHYALGEARWHDGYLEQGAKTLEEAFARDPRWQMALHHVTEYRLSRGETAMLQPVLARLRGIDPAAASALACQIAIASGNYTHAMALAREALTTLEPVPELHVCLAQAEVLANDFTAAESTTKKAIDVWPIDLREWGARAVAAELKLYRGDLEGYLADVRPSERRQHVVTLALWRPEAALVEDPQKADSVRGQPIVPATQTLVAHARGLDAKDIYDTAPELELRAYGRGLAAERRQDLPAAIAEFRTALATPSKGDMRMLVAYELAKALHASGDTRGAAEACTEVLEPHLYIAYRAALVPDCVLWSDDPVRWKQLDAAWTGAFQHPAVVEVRRRLAAL